MLKVLYHKFNVIKNIFIFQFAHLCDISFKRIIINERHKKDIIFKLKDIINSFYISLSKSFKRFY